LTTKLSSFFDHFTTIAIFLLSLLFSVIINF
jgi:hypothetical protein